MAIPIIPQYKHNQELPRKKPGESRYERLSREFDADMERSEAEYIEQNGQQLNFAKQGSISVNDEETQFLSHLNSDTINKINAEIPPDNESRYERLSREFDEDMNGGTTRTRAKNAVDTYNNMFMSPDRDYELEDEADYKMKDKISPKGWLSSQWQKYGGIVKYDNHGRPVLDIEATDKQAQADPKAPTSSMLLNLVLGKEATGNQEASKKFYDDAELYFAEKPSWKEKDNIRAINTATLSAGERRELNNNKDKLINLGIIGQDRTKMKDWHEPGQNKLKMIGRGVSVITDGLKDLVSALGTLQYNSPSPDDLEMDTAHPDEREGEKNKTAVQNVLSNLSNTAITNAYDKWMQTHEPKTTGDKIAQGIGEWIFPIGAGAMKSTALLGGAGTGALSTAIKEFLDWRELTPAEQRKELQTNHPLRNVLIDLATCQIAHDSIQSGAKIIEAVGSSGAIEKVGTAIKAVKEADEPTKELIKQLQSLKYKDVKGLSEEQKTLVNKLLDQEAYEKNVSIKLRKEYNNQLKNLIEKPIPFENQKTKSIFSLSERELNTIQRIVRQDADEKNLSAVAYLLGKEDKKIVPTGSLLEPMDLIKKEQNKLVPKIDAVLAKNRSAKFNEDLLTQETLRGAEAKKRAMKQERQNTWAKNFEEIKDAPLDAEPIVTNFLKPLKEQLKDKTLSHEQQKIVEAITEELKGTNNTLGAIKTAIKNIKTIPNIQKEENKFLYTQAKDTLKDTIKEIQESQNTSEAVKTALSKLNTMDAEYATAKKAERNFDESLRKLKKNVDDDYSPVEDVSVYSASELPNRFLQLTNEEKFNIINNLDKEADKEVLRDIRELEQRNIKPNDILEQKYNKELLNFVSPELTEIAEQAGRISKEGVNTSVVIANLLSSLREVAPTDTTTIQAIKNEILRLTPKTAQLQTAINDLIKINEKEHIYNQLPSIKALKTGDIDTCVKTLKTAPQYEELVNTAKQLDKGYQTHAYMEFCETVKKQKFEQIQEEAEKIFNKSSSITTVGSKAVEAEFDDLNRFVDFMDKNKDWYILEYGKGYEQNLKNIQEFVNSKKEFFNEIENNIKEIVKQDPDIIKYQEVKEKLQSKVTKLSSSNLKPASIGFISGSITNNLENLLKPATWLTIAAYGLFSLRRKLAKAHYEKKLNKLSDRN